MTREQKAASRARNAAGIDWVLKGLSLRAAARKVDTTVGAIAGAMHRAGIKVGREGRFKRVPPSHPWRQGRVGVQV